MRPRKREALGGGGGRRGMELALGMQRVQWPNQLRRKTYYRHPQQTENRVSKLMLMCH